MRKNFLKFKEIAKQSKIYTADLVGDYLFTDRDFVNHLLNTDRNVFQKIYDELKYLCKIATTGSKEEKELLKAKKIFDEVYRKGETKAVEGVKYDLVNNGNDSITYENSIDFYSEKQYNNFGWVRCNNVISANEYSTLLSNYAGYKHNKDKYPITKFGEVVIASQDYPGTIMYIKGSIASPEITKIIKIDGSIPESVQYLIQEEILSSEREQVLFSWGNVEAIFGEKLFNSIQKRDFPSFQELKRRSQGDLGKGDSFNNRIEQNRGRSGKESKTINEGKTNNLKSPDEKVKAFSISNHIDTLPGGNFKITSEDVTLKTPETQTKTESPLDDIPIRDDIKKLSPEDIAPPVEGTTNKINYQNYTDKDFSANAKILVSMESVKDLTGNEFKKEGNTTLKEKVMSFFNRLGNKVHSQRFGDVDLTLSSFRSEAAHGWTRGKIISFEAIPEVIQNGVVIDSQRRGNGNYDRIVVAAPITIAGQEYYMGVMLQRDNKSQRLYLHDVITKEKASIHESEHLSSNRVADETDSLFMTSILQKAVLVNSKSTQDSEEIFSAGQKSKKTSTRAELHNSIIEEIKAHFSKRGFDFDEVLSKAKDLSTFSTVDNTPQRVMEKSLGYMEGQILADETVNKVALNETEGIKWLNNYIDEIKAISKEYGIKPGSKASAAAQMYAEGFCVAKNGDIIEYGIKNLNLTFPIQKTREKQNNIVKVFNKRIIRKYYYIDN